MANWTQCIAVYAIFSWVAFIKNTDGNFCGLIRKKKKSGSSTVGEIHPQVATDIQFNTDTSSSTKRISKNAANYNATAHHSTPNDSLKIPSTPNQIESISGLKPKDMTGIFYQEGEHRYKATRFVQVLTGQVHDGYIVDIMISIEESSSSGSSSSSSDEEHKKKNNNQSKKKRKRKNKENGNKDKNDDKGANVKKYKNNKIKKDNVEENITTKAKNMFWRLFGVFTDVTCKDTGTTSAPKTFEKEELVNNSELRKSDIIENEEKINQELTGLPINDVACIVTDTTSALETFIKKEHDKNSELKKTDVDENEEKVKQELAVLQINDDARADIRPSSALDTFEKDALDNNSGLKKADIDGIEEKVKQNPELAGLQIKRKEIIIFLHSAEYEAEEAYKMLVANYRYRIDLQLFFQKLDLRSELMRRVPETLCFSILPIEYGRDNECHIYVAFLKFDLVDFDYENTIRYSIMLIEYLLKTKGTFKGVTVYFNAKGVTIEHGRAFPLYILFKLLKFVETGLPVRLISINVININIIFKVLLKGFLWANMKDTIKKKIHFYTTAKELSKQKEMINIWPHMPLEIKGQGKSQAEQSINTYKELLKVNKWYLHKQEKFKILLDRAGQSSDGLKAESETVNENG